MNMVLVDGAEVKAKLLAICDEIIENLFKSIYGLVTRTSQEMNKEIVTLQESIQAKAETTEKLVELESTIEKIRKTEHRRINNEFSDLCRWFFMLHSAPVKLGEEDLRSVHNISQLVHNLMSKVDYEENRLRREREELEGRLKKKRDEFALNIDDLAAKIDQLKVQFTSHLQVKEANEQIDILARRLQEYLAEMADINYKDELLGFLPTEVPKLLEAQNNLKP